MTEDEAKTKWCPQARIANETGAHNAEYVGGRVQPSSSCIASACMAWRVLHTDRGPVIERKVVGKGCEKPAGDEWGYEGIDPRTAPNGGEWVRWSSVVHGYCGLAGVPQ